MARKVSLQPTTKLQHYAQFVMSFNGMQGLISIFTFSGFWEALFGRHGVVQRLAESIDFIIVLPSSVEIFPNTKSCRLALIQSLHIRILKHPTKQERRFLNAEMVIPTDRISFRSVSLQRVPTSK